MFDKNIDLYKPYRGMTARQARKATKLREKRYGGYVNLLHNKELVAEVQRDPAVQMFIDIGIILKEKLVNTASSLSQKTKELVTQKAEVLRSSLTGNINRNSVSETDFALAKMFHQMPKDSKVLTFLKTPVEDLAAQSIKGFVA